MTTPAIAISSPLRRPRLCLICRMAFRPSTTAGIPVGSPQRTHEMMPRMRATLALSAVITGGRVRTAGMLCPGGTGATPGGGGTSPAGAKEYPQLLQNLDPGTFATPHFAQVIVPPRCGVLADRDT